MFQRKRVGFTLIELLVVIAIIAVLIGLLMPAVQKVRESANKTRCINNMTNLNKALLQYVDVMKQIPPSMTTPTTKRPNLKRTGTMVNFLQYLEQESTFKAYDFSKHWHQQSLEVIQAQPPVFLCPSSPNGSTRGYAKGTQDGNTYDFTNMGISDYAAVTRLHTSSPSAYSLNLLSPYSLTSTEMSDGEFAHKQGMMGYNLSCKVEDVKDGMGNTISFVEDVGRPMRLLADRRRAGFYSNTDQLLGAGWVDFNHAFDYQGYSDSGTTAGGPCGMNCSNYNEIYGAHFSGCVFGFGDGSVRFIGLKVDPRTLSILITRSGSAKGEGAPGEY
jgi:prepilin-type N-terminal cleavage/methylation domain-containing protein